MDFPVCPACHQSVIDDDAEDCPFCGASMKSKPGAKPAAVAPKPATPAAKPVGGKPGSGKPTLPGDDFPFDVELTTGKSAIPAMPNPSKQRAWQVVCPMCDTPGYVPASAVGQEVRCANVKCVMPVFTAPKPKVAEAAPPPPPPPPSSLPLFAGMTVVLILVIGGGLYYVASQPSNSSGGIKQLTDEEKQLLAESVGGPTKNSSKPKPIDPSKEEIKKSNDSKNENSTSQVDTEARIKEALKLMKEICLEKNKQRSKPYCRQMSAEANAVAGNPAAAREHLDQLLKVGNEVSYYRIIPLLDLFWIEFVSGNKKGSAVTLSDAMSEIPKIPKFGRTRQEIAGRLASALVASGRTPDALKLLTDFQSSDADAQLAARLQIALDGKVSRLSDNFSVLPWKFPQSVATTASLINRGQIDAAAAWATNQTIDDAKAECLSLWAEEIAYRRASVGAVDAGGVIATAVKTLPPAFAARVWARAGSGRLHAGDQAGVNMAIQLAKEQLAQIPSAAECKMPNVKQCERFKLPEPVPLYQAANATAELAYLQAQSATTKEDAEASLDIVLSYIDATAPSLSVAKQRHDESERLGSTGLRKLLKDEWKKKSDDEARTAANSYKRTINDIFEASQFRFETETLVLSRLRAAGVGLNSKVWIVVNTRTTADDINQRDDFFATDVLGELKEAFKGADEERAILGAWKLRSKEPAPARPVSVVFNELLKADVNRAGDILQRSELKSTRREEILLDAVSQLASESKLEDAFQLIARFEDIVLREDCYWLAATLASQRGRSEIVWKQVSQVGQQTEKIALCRGMIGGLLAVGKPVEEPAKKPQ